MSVLETHERSVEVFNDHDADAVAAVYAVEAIVYDPLDPEPLRGRQAIREDNAATFRAFPDLRTTIGNVFVQSDRIAYEMVLQGTNQGPILTPGGTIPTTNRAVEWPMAVFAHADAEHLYREVRRYYDVAGLLQQLGLDA